MSALALNAEALYQELLRGVRSLCQDNTRLVGITSGGAWLAQRLQRDLGLAGEAGQVSSVMHRDDFAQRGVSAGGDVLYTGRTIRAVMNEIFDYGRPARVQLAVLVDRGGRQLPVQADFAAARVALPETQSLALARDEAGRFSFEVENKA